MPPAFGSDEATNRNESENADLSDCEGSESESECSSSSSECDD